MARVEVKGLKELGERLKALSNDVSKKIAYSAVLAGANVIKKEAKILAPVADGPYEIEGVKVQPGNVGKQIVTKRVPKAKSTLTAEYVVAVRGKRAHGYANRVGIFNEFGTVNMPPRPFMRPAFDRQKGAAVDKIKQILTKRIDKAEKGG